MNKLSKSIIITLVITLALGCTVYAANIDDPYGIVAPQKPITKQK
jgi:hypothetical protein